MLEKLLYKIVDFGRRHPRLKVVMLVPLAIVYMLDSILYYLGMPFRLIGQAIYEHKQNKADTSDYDTEMKPVHKHKRLRNALVVFVLLALCLIYPSMRYIKNLSQPMLITAFDEIEDAELIIEQGSSIDDLKLPEQISAKGYVLDKNGDPKGNEKQITLKITSWNAEPGYDVESTAGSVYTFTPNLAEQFHLAVTLPSVQRIVAQEDAAVQFVYEIYLNGQGKDSNDGSTPMQAVQSFERAVELLGDKEGIIWIMNGITIKDEQNWSAEKAITLKRFTGSSSIPPYTGALIDIRSSGSLVLDNIILDGSEEVESNAPAIIVDGYLKLSEKTQIINNNYADHAGAIDIGNTGELILFEKTKISNCSSDVTGSSISSAKGYSLVEYIE